MPGQMVREEVNQMRSGLRKYAASETERMEG